METSAVKTRSLLLLLFSSSLNVCLKLKPTSTIH